MVFKFFNRQPQTSPPKRVEAMPRKKTPQKEGSQVKKATALVVDEVESLKKELERERGKSEDYLNKLKYLQAEFENYQKRVKREVAESIQFGNQKLITELLTVLDELEYAIDAGKSSNDKEALIQGVEITLKKLYGILEKEGLSKIEAVGKPFDPLRHAAVQKISGGNGEETVVEEIRKGFTLKGKVIRPSLVKVATKPSNSSNSSKEGDKHE